MMEPYHVQLARRRAERARVDARLRESWFDINVTWSDLEEELGLAAETLRRYGYQLGLGPRPRRPLLGSVPRPPKPSGKGGQYNGRRYEDEPGQASEHPCISAPLYRPHSSLCGNAAVMCLEM